MVLTLRGLQLAWLHYNTDGFHLAPRFQPTQCGYGVIPFDTTGARMIASTSRPSELNSDIGRGIQNKIRSITSMHGRSEAGHVCTCDARRSSERVRASSTPSLSSASSSSPGLSCTASFLNALTAPRLRCFGILLAAVRFLYSLKYYARNESKCWHL